MIIRKATYEDIPTIRAMADVVFRCTYRDILSPEQMEYMMEWMYAPESLSRQMNEGHRFFIAEEEGNAQGYASFRFDGADGAGVPVFHLEKLYVMPASQGRGVGRMLVGAVVAGVREAVGGERTRIELNVNRDNPAVGFYRKQGLRVLRQGDFPIGKGFYMNDFIMGLDLAED